MGKKKYNIIEFRLDNELRHGMIVSNLAAQIAGKLGLAAELRKEMAIAGFLHDVGKLELEKYVTRKEETLTIEEIKYVRTHATLGYTLLSAKGYPRFILESVLYHHENYDGSGYPGNLSGSDIPVGARILRVSDAYGALITAKPYRQALDNDTAIQTVIEEAKNFDMKIFLAFLELIHEEEVQKKLEDCKNMEIEIEEDILWH